MWAKQKYGPVIDSHKSSFYGQLLSTISECELEKHAKVLINLDSIKNFSVKLYDALKYYPTESIQVFDKALNTRFQRQFRRDGSLMLTTSVFSELCDLKVSEPKINEVNNLVTATARVIKVSRLLPEMQQCELRCNECKSRVEIEIDNGEIKQPKSCNVCATTIWTIIHNSKKTIFMDRQLGKGSKKLEFSILFWGGWILKKNIFRCKSISRKGV